MPLPAPRIDDRDYRALVEETLARVPVGGGQVFLHAFSSTGTEPEAESVRAAVAGIELVS